MSNDQPTLMDILFSPCFGPQIISMLHLEEKKRILWAMNEIDPALVKFYINLLWSNPWSWGDGRTDRITGYYQEYCEANYGGWPTKVIDISDIGEPDFF